MKRPMKKQQLKLCLVTQVIDASAASLLVYKHFLRQAIAGGVTMVQLRIKQQLTPEIIHFSRQVREVLALEHIPLIINDHVMLAQTLQAEGIHLGQSDMPPWVARQQLGPDKIIGLSIETTEQLLLANELSCIDYVGASAIFPSKTKTDCKTIWGLEGLEQIVKLSRHPVVAIGGIDGQNAGEVMKRGASGIAVVSALHDALDPKLAAQQLRDSCEGKI